MLSKNEVKYIQSLYQKKTRDSEGLFIAEGPKIINELLSSNFKIKEIYCTENWRSDFTKPNIQYVSESELQRISNLQTPNEILAVVEKKNAENIPSLKNKLSLVLDGIQDPGNFGTIIRTADWFGIDAIIASEDCVDLYNPKVIQATMGSFIRVNVWYKNLEEWLPEQSIQKTGTSLNGKSVFASGKIKEGILIIGNESKGIRKNVLECIDDFITIPKKGKAESLNAAVATGIILSHIVE